MFLVKCASGSRTSVVGEWMEKLTGRSWSVFIDVERWEPQAAGSDLKNKITDTSGENEFPPKSW